MSDLTFFACGPTKDHECDDKGKWIYQMHSLEITDDFERAKKEGYSMASRTCSVCGMSSYEQSLWRGE